MTTGNTDTPLKGQKLFDKVVNHLVAQGKQSIGHFPSGDEGCLYRSKDGLSCAVGCLIEDKHYTRDMENREPGYPVVTEGLRKSGVSTDASTLQLLRELQRIHDNDGCWDVIGFIGHFDLAQVASNFKLHYEVPSND